MQSSRRQWWRQKAALAGACLTATAVDDGSSDDTAARARELSSELPALRVIRYEQNRGKGHAVATGVLAARGEVVLFMDADGSVPLSEADRLLDRISAAPAPS